MPFDVPADRASSCGTGDSVQVPAARAGPASRARDRTQRLKKKWVLPAVHVDDGGPNWLAFAFSSGSDVPYIRRIAVRWPKPNRGIGRGRRRCGIQRRSAPGRRRSCPHDGLANRPACPAARRRRRGRRAAVPNARRSRPWHGPVICSDQAPGRADLVLMSLGTQRPSRPRWSGSDRASARSWPGHVDDVVADGALHHCPSRVSRVFRF